MEIKPAIQWMLLLWFLVISFLVLYPSMHLLFDYKNVTINAPPQPPTPPSPVVLSQQQDAGQQEKLVQIYNQQVAAYEKYVTAYSSFLTAYKSHVEMQNKPPAHATYELVVKETLLTVMNSFVAALLGYVFVKAGENAIRQYVNARYVRPSTT